MRKYAARNTLNVFATSFLMHKERAPKLSNNILNADRKELCAVSVQ